MTPRPPIGASRPLLPVIGRGGSRRRRRGPLALLWRRLRPAPARAPLRAGVRPIHLHPRWTLNVSLAWSLFAAPAGRRSPDPPPPGPRSGRPSRGTLAADRRPVLRLLFRQGPAARLSGGAAPPAPSHRLRLATDKRIPAGDRGRSVGPHFLGSPARPGEAIVPAGPVGRDRRPEKAGPGRMRIAPDSLRPPPPLRGPATARGASRPDPAPVAAALFPPAVRPSAPGPLYRPGRPAGPAAAAPAPRGGAAPRDFPAAPPPPRRPRIMAATEPAAPSPAPRRRRQLPLALRSVSPAAFPGSAASAAAAARAPGVSRASGPRRAADPPPASALAAVFAREAPFSRAAPAGRGPTSVPTIARRLRPALAAVMTVAPPGRRQLRSFAHSPCPVARRVAASPALPVRAIRRVAGAGGFLAIGAGAPAMRGLALQPPRRRRAGSAPLPQAPRPADASSHQPHSGWPRGRPPVSRTAWQRVERGLAGSAPGGPQPPSGRRTAAGSGPMRGPRPAGEDAIDKPTPALRRAGRARAPVASVVRAAPALAVPAAVPARPPRRPGTRPLRPAAGPNEPAPALPPARPPAPPAAMRFGSAPAPLPADAPLTPFGATQRRRPAPALHGAPRRRGVAAGGFGPMAQARTAPAARRFTFAPRLAVETLVMPGLPSRGRRVMRMASPPEAPAAAPGAAPAGVRRRPARPGASITPPAARPARRPAPPPATPVERILCPVPGRSLRPIPAGRPAAAAGGPAAAPPAELLWAKSPAAAAPTFIEKGAPPPAMAERAPISEARASPPVPAAPPPPPDINRLVDEVVRRLERQARTERLRRGL